MVSILRLAIIVFLPIVAFSQQQDLLTLLFRCRQNEVYKCGSTCIETCTYKPEICSMICNYGCFCADGYVRQSDPTGSACIKREECKTVSDSLPVCGQNEEYSTCASACPATCSDIRNRVQESAKACIALCKSGCSCKKGYYRDDNGKCVSPEDCCGKNERYKTCGSSCVETCSQKPSICTQQCVAGCFCGCSDYVRQNNSTNSPCIHRDDCAKE
ncbi:unnamed protein product [Adineta ricciae]|uniref:TIL domain-containing protein n=2 Tax=Adineta ricciae TaxID=249248 RepID=A0A813Y4X8_ADIRI|nr:unnamed protein product [Adineta ricciae]